VLDQVFFQRNPGVLHAAAVHLHPGNTTVDPIGVLKQGIRSRLPLSAKSRRRSSRERLSNLQHDNDRKSALHL